MQLHFSVTCCLARSSNSNYWATEKRIIQPALLQVFVEPYSWEVEDDFHSEQTFLWTSSISSFLCIVHSMHVMLVNTLNACGKSTANKGHLHGFVMEDLLRVTVLWDIPGRLRSSSRGEGLNYSSKALRNPFRKYIQLRKEKQNRDLMDPWSGLYSLCCASQGVHWHVLHHISPQTGALVFHLSKVLSLTLCHEKDLSCWRTV